MSKAQTLSFNLKASKLYCTVMKSFIGGLRLGNHLESEYDFLKIQDKLHTALKTSCPEPYRLYIFDFANHVYTALQFTCQKPYCT